MTLLNNAMTFYLKKIITNGLQEVPIMKSEHSLLKTFIIT